MMRRRHKLGGQGKCVSVAILAQVLLLEPPGPAHVSADGGSVAAACRDAELQGLNLIAATPVHDLPCSDGAQAAFKDTRTMESGGE